MAKPRLLVAYSNAATFVPTTMDYLNSFKLYSRYDVRYLHVTHNAEIDIDLNQFDAVFHSYCARLCFPGHVSRSYREALKRYRGVKVVAVQDEYDRTNTLRKAIQELAFEVVFTCVPNDGREYVYPRATFPDTEFITVLTGYAPSTLKTRQGKPRPLAQRAVTIGYRGRTLPAYYGQLGFDKFEIGRRMREICAERGICHDIEMTEESRIYGEAWNDFLGNCRATLGTESGCNVFDFDGSLAARYQKIEAKRKLAPSFAEFRRYTDPVEDKVSMGQISPRVFEAAAVRTPMVMFSGRYSDIVTPGDHYIELRKDFSNVDDVLDQIEDLDSLAAMADRAYDHLIASGNFDYRCFVATVDTVIDRKRAGKPSPPVARRNDPSLRPSAASAPWHLTLDEQPTDGPRDFHVYLAKSLQIVNKSLQIENEILRQKIRRLNRFRQWLAMRAPRLAKFLRWVKARFWRHEEMGRSV